MKTRNLLYLTFGLVWIVAAQNSLIAQEKPPRPMSVSALQGLNFGVFSPGTGGTVTIDTWGVRTVSPGIISIGSISYCPAVFEIDAEPGTLVRWMGTENNVLTNGSGGSMTLSIPSSSNSAVSTVRSYGTLDRIRISIGGTLTVGATTPPGNYTGEFFISFYQE